MFMMHEFNALLHRTFIAIDLDVHLQFVSSLKSKVEHRFKWILDSLLFWHFDAWNFFLDLFNLIISVMNFRSSIVTSLSSSNRLLNQNQHMRAITECSFGLHYIMCLLMFMNHVLIHISMKQKHFKWNIYYVVYSQNHVIVECKTVCLSQTEIIGSIYVRPWLLEQKSSNDSRMILIRKPLFCAFQGFIDKNLAGILRIKSLSILQSTVAYGNV